MTLLRGYSTIPTAPFLINWGISSLASRSDITVSTETHS